MAENKNALKVLLPLLFLAGIQSLQAQAATVPSSTMHVSVNQTLMITLLSVIVMEIFVMIFLLFAFRI